MTWADFPYAAFAGFLGTFGICGLCAYALIK